MHANFAVETLTSLFCYLEKVFVYMNTWIARKDLMKLSFQIKKLFTVNCIQKTSLTKTTHKLIKCLKNSNLKTLAIEEFKFKNLGHYHDLYFQSHTLLADVVENFRNKCIEIYELVPAHFLSATGLA